MPEQAVEPPPPAADLPLLEARWPASLSIVVAVVLYLTLPELLVLGPRWVFPALEAAILLPLTVARPHRHPGEAGPSRIAAIALIGLATLGNVASLGLLVHVILGGFHITGRTLIVSAIEIYLTNVIVFGLWYWELDGGGPAARLRPGAPYRDFLFPQMNMPDKAPPGWRPTFFDYLYVSLTNATAFSPTDTLPLTRKAKGLMAIQCVASLLTVALVAGRAVNVLT
ncbi:MAG: DUF1345 domain-containing protein [Candidatus Dormibacteraeota bacterium]|nr:DUF1345 domain-containing protein [Candidatus Dormibacteraeota bacterium]